MANIRINALPPEASPVPTDVLAIDGTTTRKTTLAAAVTAGRPLADQGEAEAGVDSAKAMTPLTTKQAIAAIGGGLFATTAQGGKADTAVQPARTITAGTGLTGGGDLSANRSLALDGASVASLGKADTAVQPALTVAAGTGLTGGGDLSTNRSIALDGASIASLGKADTAVQPGSLASVATTGAYNDLTGKPTLGTAAATAAADYATAAQGAKADTALQSVVAGTNVTVDASDPLNPVISSSGGGGDTVVFNAVAEGFTDLQLAIDAAELAGKDCYIGGKGVVWTITSGVSIPDDMTVFGNLLSGYGAKIDASSGEYTAVSLGDGSALIGVEAGGSGSASYAAGSIGLYQSGVNNDPAAPTYVEGATIKNCYIHDFGNALIEMRYTQNAKIEGCTLAGGGYAGIGLISVLDVDVYRNNVSDIGPGSDGNAYGIFVSRLSGTYTVNPQSERVTVRECKVTDMELWHAFDTHGGIDVSFIDCTSIRSPRAFIITSTGDGTNGYRAPQRCKVKGCKAFGMTTRAERDQGLWVLGAWNGSAYSEYATNCVVEDNYFFQHGVDLVGSRGAAAVFSGTRNLLVQGLNIDQASGHGIQFDKSNIDYSVDGLIITDPNSMFAAVIGILFGGDSNLGRICNFKILHNDAGLATYVTDIGIYSSAALSVFQLTLQNGRNLALTATSYSTSPTAYDV